MITQQEIGELGELYHAARTALAGTGRESRYDRLVWATEQFCKVHPIERGVVVYKAVDRATRP